MVENKEEEKKNGDIKKIMKPFIPKLKEQLIFKLFTYRKYTL